MNPMQFESDCNCSLAFDMKRGIGSGSVREASEHRVIVVRFGWHDLQNVPVLHDLSLFI